VPIRVMPGQLDSPPPVVVADRRPAALDRLNHRQSGDRSCGVPGGRAPADGPGLPRTGEKGQPVVQRTTRTGLLQF
jgi:hypothetical protein